MTRGADHLGCRGSPFSTTQLDPYDLDQLDAIVSQPYNIARRHGYPMDLSDLFREAEAVLVRYRAAVELNVEAL